ncbi:MAG: nitrilase-related carbon-nitrogen hydrolase [Synergistaceae bacterium]|nr:nitrilase-related carbon-nitrogen hydrolase [Synergistaceae bacterium]
MLRIGTAQIDIKLGERRANFQAVAEWMERYHSPSDTETVVLLPELFDVGYVIDKAERYADEEAAQAADFLGGLARKDGVWFAGGSVLAMTAEGAVNRALVVNPRGEYVAHYDKAHLVPMMDEEKYLHAGSAACLFEIGGVPLCLAICYDLRFCEWLRMGALAGARLCLISAEWPAARIEHWRTLLRARAIENMMFVAACNRVGDTPSESFGGHSAVIDPWGETLYEGGGGEEGAFVVIDPKEAERARSFIRAFDMRRPELYRL